MSEQDMRAVVIRAIEQVAPDVDAGAIDPEASLTEELEIDSMDMLNIVVSIAAQTGIEIPERDYPKLATLTDAAAYLAGASRREGHHGDPQ